uniref:Uncharacterized protein n=1 Tax=Triticum urartu TaxID=4572 RepID=A0A8R7QK50_TRIUA
MSWNTADLSIDIIILGSAIWNASDLSFDVILHLIPQAVLPEKGARVHRASVLQTESS